jgi:hypothetical protein
MIVVYHMTMICCGATNSGEGNNRLDRLLPITSPSNLAYSSSTLIFYVGVALYEPPTYDGVIDSFSLSSSVPDSGITFGSSSGVIGGVPKAATPPTVITVTGTDGQTDVMVTISIQVKESTCTYPSLITYNTNSGVPFSAVSPSVTPPGGLTSFSISPQLPPGFQFDSSTGVISGTFHRPPT